MVDILKEAKIFIEKSLNPVVLALQYRQKGSRLFMVTSHRHVFHYLCYLRIHRSDYDTWHEILSGLTPQRLYFDLDFYWTSNPEMDTGHLMRNLQALISGLLAQHFNWTRGEESNLVFLDLDASTGEKFSHHVIVHMRNHSGNEVVLFDNLIKLKSFVIDRVAPLLEEKGFYVQPRPGLPTNGGDGVPLVDLSVYGPPGQNFRLLGSPKFGHKNILRLLNPMDVRHDFEFHDPTCGQCEQSFRECLITTPAIMGDDQ